MDKGIEALRWLVAHIITAGPQSWSIQELYKEFGEEPIEYLLANDFLLGKEHLRVSKEGVYYILVGGLPTNVPSQEKQAELGRLISHLALRDILIASGENPSTAPGAATRTFEQLLRHAGHVIEFVCTSCWQLRDTCRHSGFTGGRRWVYHNNASHWQATERSLLKVTVDDLRRVSPTAANRTLTLRDHLVKRERSGV